MAHEIGRRVIARADVRYSSHTHTGGPRGSGPRGSGPVIDGDYQDVTDGETDETPAGRRIDHEDPDRPDRT